MKKKEHNDKRPANPHFNDAFKGLQGLKKALVEEEVKAKAPPPPPPKKQAAAPLDDDAGQFLRAMQGVRRMGDDGRGERVRRAEPAPVKIVSEESDALIDLASSIDVDTQLSGVEPGKAAASRGLDPSVIKKLQRGDFGYDAELDLHGMRKREAEAALERFLKMSRASKRRVVLVVTGKGLHSDAGGPVLADAVRHALCRTFVKHVLAYSVARPEDGGDGALYVLLRRR
jgi:DNA-nicking Smr family endonuclease